MTTIYKFTQDVGPNEWHPLPREFKVGDVVHRYSGYDYGCARDDWTMGKRSTIACSLDGGIPFFTVPVEWLQDEQGQQVTGAYGNE